MMTNENENAAEKKLPTRQHLVWKIKGKVTKLLAMTFSYRSNCYISMSEIDNKELGSVQHV
jgi:hypothetical protein